VARHLAADLGDERQGRRARGGERARELGLVGAAEGGLDDAANRRGVGGRRGSDSNFVRGVQRSRLSG
jgi:hypothetical protein